jgi:hypothetical protein
MVVQDVAAAAVEGHEAEALVKGRVVEVAGVLVKDRLDVVIEDRTLRKRAARNRKRCARTRMTCRTTRNQEAVTIHTRQKRAMAATHPIEVAVAVVNLVQLEIIGKKDLEENH